MTKVYIAQLKCPQNHCVFATAGEFDDPDKANDLALLLGFEMGRLVISGALKHECGICKSTELKVEIGATRFRTMAEAEPFLRQSQADQIATAAFLKAGRN
jgi:hypothetical protein